MTTKHTPAPWTWMPGFSSLWNDETGQAVLGVAGPALAQDVVNDPDEYWVPTEANARLIAQAPELLEALLKAVKRQGFSNDELIAARAAIAKATGGRP